MTKVASGKVSNAMVVRKVKSMQSETQQMLDDYHVSLPISNKTAWRWMRASGAQAGVASGAWTVGILTSQPSGVLKKVGCKLLIQDYTDQRFLQVLKGESV